MKRFHDVTRPVAVVFASLSAMTLALSLCVPAGAKAMKQQGTTPHCAANDPLVAVDARTKTYSPAMVPTTETMKKAGTSTTKMMCTSKAKAMGAHLKQSGPHPTAS